MTISLADAGLAPSTSAMNIAAIAHPCANRTFMLLSPGGLLEPCPQLDADKARGDRRHIIGFDDGPIVPVRQCGCAGLAVGERGQAHRVEQVVGEHVEAPLALLLLDSEPQAHSREG